MITIKALIEKLQAIESEKGPDFIVLVDVYEDGLDTINFRFSTVALDSCSGEFDEAVEDDDERPKFQCLVLSRC